jgi:hypothetical protein
MLSAANVRCFNALGAYGYDVQSGRELLLADKPDDFAQPVFR